MNKGIWVVVADGTKARILQSNEETGELDSFREFPNPDAQRPGFEAETFAKRVVLYVTKAFVDKRVAELRFVAPPRFLEQLRASLSPALTRATSEYLNEDLIGADNGEIKRRLFSGHEEPVTVY
jgi:protein required for attachment to host cells